jgi:hypothetical protein
LLKSLCKFADRQNRSAAKQNTRRAALSRIKSRQVSATKAILEFEITTKSERGGRSIPIQCLQFVAENGDRVEIAIY